MNEGERGFLRANHRAILATKRADGGVQMSPVLAVLDGDELLISTQEATAKYRNLSRHPYAWVCVINERFFGQWLDVSGPVEIVRGEEAIEPLVHYYRLASGEHSNWDEYRQAMRTDRRVLVKVRVERTVGPV
ncbi:MAG TPA: PPOX class F420-dependent oxidoreductase [Chloroflexota bacterium]|nr:PPOX class F420-dependent oxidoreductase [Chloroflexota bacterium]